MPFSQLIIYKYVQFGKEFTLCIDDVLCFRPKEEQAFVWQKNTRSAKQIYFRIEDYSIQFNIGTQYKILYYTGQYKITVYSTIKE